MQKTNQFQYSNLSKEQKRAIDKNLEMHKKMRFGFYSPVYSLIINNEKHDYRFHSKLNNNKKETTIVFNLNEKAHTPYSKGNIIHFYDNDLKRTLKIDKKIFEGELETEINFNISNEQKELLADGHDITLEVTLFNSKKSTNRSGASFLLGKKELRSFIADYSFFLGKTDLPLKDVTKTQKHKNTNQLNLSK